mmetsp:Transcript_17801/g.46049  ORF Transcript_17801/g.46049 Transcript_17801/m.46049 type:complete len:215 (-) Transcript_17801:574-1218(-)
MRIRPREGCRSVCARRPAVYDHELFGGVDALARLEANCAREACAGGKVSTPEVVVDDYTAVLLHPRLLRLTEQAHSIRPARARNGDQGAAAPLLEQDLFGIVPVPLKGHVEDHLSKRGLRELAPGREEAVRRFAVPHDHISVGEPFGCTGDENDGVFCTHVVHKEARGVYAHLSPSHDDEESPRTCAWCRCLCTGLQELWEVTWHELAASRGAI